MTNYVCNRCSTSYRIEALRYKCDCGFPLTINKPVPSFPIDSISARANSLWRYREAIPISDDASIVTLGEGMTPLLPSNCSTNDHHLKLDFVSPTGSYKDRGASVLLSKFKELGSREVIDDSSGNAGAAIAAYSARADIGCTIYCPVSASKGKLSQISMHGANLELIDGNRAATTEAILKVVRESHYASHTWNPFFLEGTKTVAFEIAEQLGWRVPDHVICPIGAGSIYLGLYMGFGELHAGGVIRKMPRLLGVQADACCPIYTAYNENRVKIECVPQTHETLAEGIVAECPVRSRRILDVRCETEGAITIVNEEEIKCGIKVLASQGIYVEPTSAVVVKAFDKFVEAGIIRRGDLVVSILTGSGLKATDKLSKMA